MADPATVASMLAGGASIVVSAAAVGVYRVARRIVRLTEANRRDLRGAEPNDRGVVHYVREHRAALRRNGLVDPDDDDFLRGGTSEDDRDESRDRVRRAGP